MWTRASPRSGRRARGPAWDARPHAPAQTRRSSRRPPRSRRLGFGGPLFALFVLGPIVMSLPPQMQVAISRAAAKRTNVIFETLGGITILLGIVRGTLLGPVQSPGFLLGTPYGIAWGIALVLAL